MTQQDDITQSADWDVAHEIWAAAQTPPRTSIESAVERIVDLLSKLRAEGVPVVGMPEYITDNRYHIQYRLGWNNCLSDCRAAMQGAAPVASAPADERAAFEAAWCQVNSPAPLNTRRHDDGRYADVGIERDWHLWQARAALASAPVDPEAEEVDFLVRVLQTLETWRAEEWNELIERRPAILALLRPLVLASAPVAQEARMPPGYRVKVAEGHGYRITAPSGSDWVAHSDTPAGDLIAALLAAPQASEAVLEAVQFVLKTFKNDEAQGFRSKDRQFAISILEQALKSQADRDGGQQRAGVVTDDMRYAVRFAPSSAHWSERLMEFFGPDAREGIDALEKQLREARAALSATQTEQGGRDE